MLHFYATSCSHGKWSLEVIERNAKNREKLWEPCNMSWSAAKAQKNCTYRYQMYRVKPGFHYTRVDGCQKCTRVDGPWTLVHFLTLVNSGVIKCTRVHGPSTRVVETGLYSIHLVSVCAVFLCLCCWHMNVSRTEWNKYLKWIAEIWPRKQT